MKDDYLWNRSGPSDPEIERLEQTLSRFRYRHRPDLAQAGRNRPAWHWAAAAAAAVVIAAVWQFNVLPGPATDWQVAGVQGRTRMGSREAALSDRVRAGQVLRTGVASRLTLLADEVGKIDLGPESELRAANNRKIVLNRGMLHAFIWARPRQFVLDTPSSRAVDLGCEYTITVAPSGDGLLRVSRGWVAFQYGDRESFIPEGAVCVTRKRGGPGIPYYEDAPDVLKQSLENLETGNTRALDGILSAARPRDGLTLWHLLTRAPERDRGRVFDRFAQLEPLPADVTRAGAIKKDARTLDLCWNALNLENTDWWRGWERRWE